MVMLIELKRVMTVPSVPMQKGYTVGHLSVNGAFLCDTLEPEDFKWGPWTDLADIFDKKAVSTAAIPTGKYLVGLRVKSAKFRANTRYQELCFGCPPRLFQVPGFVGVLFHSGNTAYDTQGCILLGYYSGNGRLIKSWEAFSEFYRTIRPADIRGEDIWCEISRVY